MAKKVCWHSPANKQLVLDVGSKQAVIHRLWISRGEEGITPTLSQSLCSPCSRPDTQDLCPLQWDICSPTPLSCSQRATEPFLLQGEQHREGITHPLLSFPTSAPFWSSIPKNPGELRPGCAVEKVKINKAS